MSNKTYTVAYSIDQETKTFRSTARDLNKTGNQHWGYRGDSRGIGSVIVDRSQVNRAPYVIDIDGLSKREAERYQWAKDAILRATGYNRAVANVK